MIITLKDIALGLFWILSVLGLVWPVLWLIEAIFCVACTVVVGIWATALLLEIDPVVYEKE